MDRPLTVRDSHGRVVLKVRDAFPDARADICFLKNKSSRIYIRPVKHDHLAHRLRLRELLQETLARIHNLARSPFADPLLLHHVDLKGGQEYDPPAA